MTNYEKIKAMSVEEMVNYISDSLNVCEDCPAYRDETCDGLISRSCEEELAKWLLQEVEE